MQPYVLNLESKQNKKIWTFHQFEEKKIEQI